MKRLTEVSAVKIQFVPYFLGIDGGGTKTRCILGDDESQLGTGSSSSSKVQRIGEACARDSLSAAIHEACVQAGVSPRKIARTCAGITGTGRPEIAGIMRDLMMSLVGGEVEIVGDIQVAFEDAFGTEAGVIVVAGTGAIAYGRNSQGQTARAGGWGYPISDEGSGYWIGVEAVRMGLRIRDHGDDPILLKELADGLGAKDFDDLVMQLNANPAPDFAALFPIVLSSGERGDQLAKEVLQRAGQELAMMAETVVTRLFNGGSCSVATHGGVFSSNVIVMESFERELKARRPNARLLDRAVDPARGALERAKRGFKAATA